MLRLRVEGSLLMGEGLQAEGLPHVHVKLGVVSCMARATKVEMSLSRWSGSRQFLRVS